MKLFTWIIAVTVLCGAFLLILKQSVSAPTPEKNIPGVYDQFAQCLKEKGAVFYGASWCSHCQAQKESFGNSVHLLPYVECSTPDGQGQTSACADKKIMQYPTWIFADGSQETGNLSMEKLAEKTGCAIPGAKM